MWSSNPSDESQELIEKLRKNTGFKFVPAFDDVHKRLSESYATMNFQEFYDLCPELEDFVHEDVIGEADLDVWLPLLTALCQMAIRYYTLSVKNVEEQWKKADMVLAYLMLAGAQYEKYSRDPLTSRFDWVDEDHAAPIRKALDECIELAYWLIK